ncbi:MAG TPA: sucrase ferredoxin [Mycobacteriales bacterium]|nr:sucrase ferredoxin [Mycobacteriales bacterium]
MDPNGGPGPSPAKWGSRPEHGPAGTTAGPRRQCAALSQSLAEPLAATAPPGGGSWLAVEHVGPWPSRAEDAHLALPAGGGVLRRAVALGIRVQLIRRSGRHHPEPPGRTVLVSSTRGGQPWLERIVMDHPGALDRLDLAALADGRAPGFGRPSRYPELLVCTHGRKDTCCARHGRPVAATMRAAHPDRVWETTHLGGDRFAGNVACLPPGTYHGRVTADTARAVATACLAGEVHLPTYRGRTGLPGPAQAAEHAVRQATGLVRLDQVIVRTVQPLGRAHLVVLLAGGRRIAVPVRPVHTGPPRPTSCAGCTQDVPTSYLPGSLYLLPDPPHTGYPRHPPNDPNDTNRRPGGASQRDQRSG